MNAQTINHTPKATRVRQAVATALDGWRYERKPYGGEWDYTDNLGDTYLVSLSVDRLELEVQGPSITTPEGWTTVEFRGLSHNASDHVVTLDGLADLFSALGVPEAGE